MTESLIARGRVIAVHPHDTVTVECATACPGCRCGRYFSDPTRRIELRLGRSGQSWLGRTLDISVASAEVLRVSLWLYGVPWLALLLGTLLGGAAGRTDQAALLGALIGLVGGVAVLKRVTRSMPAPHLEVRVDE